MIERHDRYDTDYILCECDLDPLRDLIAALEPAHRIAVVKAPATCLTMIRAEDSLEQQPFYLGEALTTECEVSVDGASGLGVCLGDEPVRAYCLAVVDAFVHGGTRLPPALQPFLDEQRSVLERRDLEEFNQILRTQVDFKLMEQE